MASDSTPLALHVAGKAFTCLACQEGTRFYQREVRMNTSSMSLLGLDWLNKAADGAFCENCGYVHQFMGENHTWS